MSAITIVNPQPWTEQAPCQDRWDRFDAESHRTGRSLAQTYRDELGLCATCPVLDECRRYAIQIEPIAGIWAGEVFRGERTAKAALARMRAAAGLPPAEPMQEAV